jgi:stage V sporulation protein SpoVS
MVKLATEAYPGELAELRAVAAILKARGCVTCQMRATMAIQLAKRAATCAREFPLQHVVLQRPTTPTEPTEE